MLSKFKNEVFFGYIFKSIISSVSSILLLCLLTSVLIEKVQISTDKYSYFSCIIIVLSCIITSLCSTSKLKNNVVLFGVLSNVLVYLVTTIILFITNDFLQFVICIASGLVTSLLISLIVNKRKKRIRI